MEICKTRLEKKRVHKKKGTQGRSGVLRRQLGTPAKPGASHQCEKSPPVWEALVRASKHQQLLVLQRAFDTAAEDMGLRAPTIVTPSLLKSVLALGFWMESWDDLTTGIHPFVLGQHTATVRKFLHGKVDRYAMVASGAGAPSLADLEILSAPDGVTLPRNFSMARGQWLRTRLIVGTCFGVDHNASEGLREFGEEMSAR